MPRLPEPRVAIIEGRHTLIEERRPPLPPSLELLLEGGRGPDGRYYPNLKVSSRSPLTLTGTRATCTDRDHRLNHWLDGLHLGTDGIVRHLRLQACLDCGTVCVRDVSTDTLTGLPSGRQPLRRRDHVIGWYSGARPRQRVYT